jgi:hypothetical protein
MNAQEMIKKLEDELKPIFPDSFMKIVYNTNLNRTIIIYFALGKDNSEYINNIRDNDPMHNIIFIGNYGPEIKTDGTLPEKINVKSAFFGLKGHTKEGYKKLANLRQKTDTPEKIISYLKKYFLNLKELAKENLDLIPKNIQYKILESKNINENFLVETANYWLNEDEDFNELKNNTIKDDNIVKTSDGYFRYINNKDGLSTTGFKTKEKLIDYSKDIRFDNNTIKLMKQRFKDYKPNDLNEDEIILSYPEIVNYEENKSFVQDNRKKFTWVVIEYTGSDNYKYRKSFNFEQGLVNKNGGLDKEKIFSIIPKSGTSEDITKISKKPIYKSEIL